MVTLSDKLDAIIQGVSSLTSEVWIAVLLFAIIVTDLTMGNHKKGKVLGWMVLIGAFANFFWINLPEATAEPTLFLGMIRWWPDAPFLKNLFNAAVIVSVSLAIFRVGKSEDERLLSGEYLAVLLGILLGLQMMVGAANWLLLYLSIELVSIGSYILTFFRYNQKSAEASLKYLIFGAVSSATMLYGISLLYGLTGTLQFPALEAESLGQPIITAPPIAFFMGYSFLFAGLFFKIAAIPFHIWVPDVYESAPTPLVAFLSVAPKAAALTVLLHIIDEWRFIGDAGEWLIYLMVGVSALSMLVGNFSALWQKDAKRLLGYSSIAHAGFMLMAVLSFSATGRESFYFYLVVYFFLTFAGFFLISFLEENQEADMDSMKGIGLKKPWLGILVLVVMIGLTGLPFTAGFTAKLFIFTSLWETYQLKGDSMYIWLFSFGLLNTVVALYYYLKMPYFMFFKEGASVKGAIQVSMGQKVFIAVLVLPILLFFFKPDWLQSLIQSMIF